MDSNSKKGLRALMVMLLVVLGPVVVWAVPIALLIPPGQIALDVWGGAVVGTWAVLWFVYRDRLKELRQRSLAKTR
jgi:hypothetical protein